MAKTIALVGPGRVGQTLARALRRRGYRIGPVVGTNLRSTRRAVQFIGGGKAAALLDAGVSNAAALLDAGVSNADVVLICTPDRAVARVARALSRLPVSWPGKVVLHTSGALSSRELTPLVRKGAAMGSFHPLYPFSRPLREFPRGVAFGIEGSPRAEKEARRLALVLGGISLKVRVGKKQLYHAAAVFAAGHLMTGFDAGVRAMARTGLPEKKARQALLPLARATLEAYEKWGTRAWTGPVARGELDRVRGHLEALRRAPRPVRDLYAALARAGLVLHRPGKKASAQRLQRLLGRGK